MKRTEEILKINPKSQEAMLLKGRIFLSRNEFDQALNLFQTYAKDNPKAAMAHYLIAMAHYGNRNMQQAKAALAEAVTLNPKAEEPRLLLAEIQLREGSAGQDQAIDGLNAVLKDHPGSVQAHLLLGNGYLLKRNLPEATKVFENLIKIAPNNPVGYTQMGRILLIQKKEKEAWPGSKRPSLCSPTTWTPFSSWSSFHMNRKEPKKAIDRVEQQIKLSPKNPLLYNMLGNIYAPTKMPRMPKPT